MGVMTLLRYNLKILTEIELHDHKRLVHTPLNELLENTCVYNFVILY